jgi:glycosyltransferase involved in cell wall biosynthesis
VSAILRKASIEDTGMNVLLLSYHWEPSNAVGGQRPAAFAEALLDRGHSVRVLTSTPGSSTTAGGQEAKQVPNRLTVDRVRDIPHPRQLFVRFKALISQRRSKAHAAREVAGYAPTKRHTFWFRHLMAFLKTPDENQGFITPALARALRTRRQFKPDVLITTSPPFSVHIAGLLYCVLFDTYWVADFRDPFVGSPAKRYRNRLTDGIDAWLQRLITRKANLVLTGSRSLLQSLQPAHKSAGSDRFLVIRNGISTPATTLVDKKGPPTGPIRFGYFGTLYLGRDPRPLLDGFVEARRRQGACGGRPFQLHFWGPCHWYYDVDVQAAIAARRLNDAVSLHGSVGTVEARKFMREVDVLVLLAQKQPLQIPHKLYEYLECDKPVVALVDHNGETAGVLAEIGGRTVMLDSTDPDAIAGALTEAAALAESGVSPGQFRHIEAFSIAKQMRAFTDALEAPFTGHVRDAASPGPTMGPIGAE